MLNVLYIGINYSNYGSANYQNDLLETLKSLYNVKCYGPGFKGYKKIKSIREVLIKLKFEPDILLISNTWEIQDPSIENFDPNPNLKLNEIDIPKLFFLNKEYKKLEAKLRFIVENNIDFVTSVLKEKCDIWENQLGAKFIWEPFGVKLDKISKHKDKIRNRKYDFAFSGNLHRKWTTERVKVKQHIFKEKFLKFERIHNFIHTKRFKDKYSHLKIFWAEWQERKIFPPFMRRVPFGKNYYKFLAEIKIGFSTKSALGIMNPRFFELMASKALIICPKENYYNILKDRHNCVMYKDLNEFDEILFLHNEDFDLRKEITENAYNEVLKYSWDMIVKDLFKKIL